MCPSDLHREIQLFLSAVFEGEESSTDTLIAALDKLAMSLHELVIEFDESEYEEPPDLNYADIRTVVEKKFPELGLYNTAEHVSIDIGDSKLIVGEAVDDLADIIGDMLEVSWRFENTSEMDAMWHFENSFTLHWGRHLRDLQHYLFNLTQGT